MSSINLRSVSKCYSRGVTAISDLSLQVLEGEYLTVLGPSGSGKSTLLHLIAGLEEPTAGTIEINGRDVTGVPPKDRGVAMVFQNHALYPHLSVYKNLAFGLKLSGAPRSEFDQRVRAAAAATQVERLLDRKPESLSGGERQRVAIAKAVAREPACLLLDEPLSNLDVHLRERLRGELKGLHRKVGGATVHVTHDQDEALLLGDRVAIVDKGVLQQCASASEIYRNPVNRFVAGFVGSPPMNFLEGQLSSDHDNVYLRVGGARLDLPTNLQSLKLPGKSIVLGVRPEAVSFHAWPVGPPLELRGVVRDVVVLGDRANVELQTPAGTIASRASPADAPEVGRDLTIYLDPARLHLLEPGSHGKSLSLPN
jgi:multiple sugar transport system ATP-binding protein